MPRLRLMLRDRRGAIAMMFALSVLPLTLIVALATDYSFYIQARAQLNLAADAAAMHAVRVASQAYSRGYTTVAQEQQAGQAAGQQWFTAQLGTLFSGTISASNIAVSVVYNASPGGFTSTVTYTASVPTHLGAFIIPAWTISSTASATITNHFVEIVMLLDNSSSMLIGATLTDMIQLEKATICSTQSATAGQDMTNYSWNYQPTYGYLPIAGAVNPPPASPVNGSCDPAYDGDPTACIYVPTAVSTISATTGLCTNGGGSTTAASPGLPAHTPQAPCAFACHTSASNNDYYGLARSLTPKISLRLDVVHQAAANVITTLEQRQEIANQFSVGIYEFNTALSTVYPTSGNGEAGTNLPAALTAMQNTPSPVTQDVANTYFTSAANTLAGMLAPNGTGLSAASPSKNLFIVTDGLSDAPNALGIRIIGPMTDPNNEQTCQQFKNLGYNVYVLYTPYLPIPNPFFLVNTKSAVEPTASSPVIQALQACVSNPGYFFQASDPASINTAMQAMLLSAVNAPARIAQ